MELEELKMLENLCRFMIEWSEREPDSIIPDPLGLTDDNTEVD